MIQRIQSTRERLLLSLVVALLVGLAVAEGYQKGYALPSAELALREANLTGELARLRALDSRLDAARDQLGEVPATRPHQVTTSEDGREFLTRVEGLAKPGIMLLEARRADGVRGEVAYTVRFEGSRERVLEFITGIGEALGGRVASFDGSSDAQGTVRCETKIVLPERENRLGYPN